MHPGLIPEFNYIVKIVTVLISLHDLGVVITSSDINCGMALCLRDVPVHCSVSTANPVKVIRSRLYQGAGVARGGVVALELVA